MERARSKAPGVGRHVEFKVQHHGLIYLETWFHLDKAGKTIAKAKVSEQGKGVVAHFPGKTEWIENHEQ